MIMQRRWGQFGNGKLGTGSTVNQLTPVLPVSGITGSTRGKSLAAGEHHMCAVRLNRTAACWGQNTFGQLGDGTTIQRLSPSTSVSGLTNILALGAGAGHTCALPVGDVRCWADNQFGQIGNGTASTQFLRLAEHGPGPVLGTESRGQLGDGSSVLFSATPRTVTGSVDIVALAAGGLQTCALDVRGTVSCWGYNN
jgi:alpha-tubulin suppressor-like RCC1 family protein